MSFTRFAATAAAIALVQLSVAVTPTVASSRIDAVATALRGGPDIGSVEVSTAVHHDVSAALRDLPDQATNDRPRREHPLLIPNAQTGGTSTDGALQTTTGPKVATTAGLSFAGVGNGDYGFAPNAAPPDTNGAVGATQYVQWVNESFAVFNKATGALVKGPTAGNTLWTGFGGGCETNNDGDPIAQYDKAANRWVLTQFSVSTTPYLQCVAVSTTSDATGTYNRYSFNYGTVQFPDYPKLGVWPDAYYVTYNIFNNGATFAGAKACAWDRAAMIAGAATATQECFQMSTAVASLLPSDLDGATAPPAGAQNILLNFGTNSLNAFKFHVDFATPANASLTGPTVIPVAAFSRACNGGSCVPQPGTRQKLDSLADRLMYRLAYRNRAGAESLVVNHSVNATGGRNGVAGIRWYQLDAAAIRAGTSAVTQQGTFAPDTTFRWMGSVAMDKVGDIAVGYSASSSGVFPSIRMTGRVPGDAAGTLQTENQLLTGGGSQIGGLSRWGDYSAMTVDPVDDCTFFYTTEYLKSTGSFNWSTQIVSFKFPGCF